MFSILPHHSSYDLASTEAERNAVNTQKELTSKTDVSL
ncbi:hypothetical protein Taro_052312 [Colocasia esculenta]|uniref:Uncharacterized protein n=1 Tax=Colocasia esculenta TaxID=4460 RepID=A0A843XI99_COLES|nr:hypothetical protein [Colocasia esculenta]